ncbi:hypothetical protein FRC07_006309 [Ceratobasidium sp. 392]|nr:hypothetical protein FRC07_006309 [Ceratobasidium sp. 392]
MRLTLAVFVALTAATAVSAQPRVRTIKAINPDRNSIPGVADWGNVPAPAPVVPSTNAKRFAMSLPPLAPRAHRQHPHRAAPHRLGTRVQAAPRSQVSAQPPVDLKCNVLVTAFGHSYGYLSPAFNDFGEYGLFQSNTTEALVLSFSYSRASPKQLDAVVTNGPAATTYPYFGAAVGFASRDSSLGPGDSDYLFVVGTSQTPPGSLPVEGNNTFSVATDVPAAYQSAIWSLDLETLYITAEWVNSDGSVPTTSFVYADDENHALLITGDAEALRNDFNVSYPDVHEMLKT